MAVATQAEDKLAFNAENFGDIATANANQATAEGAVAIRSGGDTNLNQSTSGNQTATASGGAIVLGTGATFLQDLDADLALGVVNGANANQAILLNSIAAGQTGANSTSLALANGLAANQRDALEYNAALSGVAIEAVSKNAASGQEFVSGIASQSISAAQANNALFARTIAETTASGQDMLAGFAGGYADIAAATQAQNASLTNAALSSATANVSSLLDFFKSSQTQNQEFQAGLVAGFQGIAEANGSTLRGALSATLGAPVLATPADTTAGKEAETSAALNQRLALIAGGLLALYLLTR